ncbi:MAG: chorismate-binding protein, partial [Planctomycetota bacterium]|nr:chorismate-binding protein [Planctomycetota bacterium]
DAARVRALAAAPKDLAEHSLVRDHVLAALGPLAEDIQAPDQPSVRSLASLHHLHTSVEASLRAGVDDADLLAALHPTPAVCGTPTAEARSFLRATEPFDRGLYAGPIGCFGVETSEVAVALRCALVQPTAVQVYAGAGIVAGSEAHAEWEETAEKMRVIEAALEVLHAR